LPRKRRLSRDRIEKMNRRSARAEGGEKGSVTEFRTEQKDVEGRGKGVTSYSLPRET